MSQFPLHATDLFRELIPPGRFLIKTIDHDANRCFKLYDKERNVLRKYPINAINQLWRKRLIMIDKYGHYVVCRSVARAWKDSRSFIYQIYREDAELRKENKKGTQ